MKTLLYILVFVSLINIPLFGQEKIKLKNLNNKLIIQANLNGKSGYFLVDTGSDITILHSEAKKWYKFKCFYSDKSRLLNSLNTGNLVLYNTYNVQLSIGEKRIETNFFAYNLSQLVDIIKKSTGIKICGIIGGDIMQRYHFVIDYRDKYLVIQK